jgi:hypothetical protein
MAVSSASPLLGIAGLPRVGVAHAVAVATGWTTYHHDNSRNGYDQNAPALGTSTPSTWDKPVDQSVYAEPLVYAGHIYVVTMGDSVYSFDATTGNQTWARIGLASASTLTYCSFNPGHIGIMSTPVIDPSSNVLYAVGLTTSPTTKYVMFGLNLSDGSNAAGFPVDLTPAGFSAVNQNQRAALALGNGHLYVAFGGWAGDCGTYHPWVMSVPTTGGAVDHWYQPQTGCQNGAGIWGPSGIAIDGSGTLYIATGNGTGCYGVPNSPCTDTMWDHGNAMIKLSPTLAEGAFFAPSNWCDLTTSDTDVGSIGPALLPGTEVFQTGKSGDGWLLNGGSPGGFGGQQFEGHIGSCRTGGAIFGGLAYFSGRIYVPCDGVGLVAFKVDTTGHTFSTTPDWTASGISAGPPIAAMGLIWTRDQSGSWLYGYDPITGVQRVKVAVGGGSNHFGSLAEDAGWIFVPHGSNIRAFNFTSPPPMCGGSPCLLYTLDGWGGVQPNAGLAPVGQTAYWPGWDIARGLVLTPDSTVGAVKGYTMDGWGGLHPFGGAAAVTNNGYWPGSDIARAIAWAPGSGETSANPGGWTLDAYGGVHPFGNAASAGPTAYWAGWNIARGLVVLPDSSLSAPKGYTLDGWGGLHPFGGAPPITNNSYWPGWDIARAIVLAPWATSGNVVGWTLDAWGGVHPFGAAAPVGPTAYWPNWDIARGLIILPNSTGPVQGYNLDGWGGLHAFGGAPAVSGPYWPGWDIARGTADQGINSGSRHP